MPNAMSLAEGFICLSFGLLHSGPQLGPGGDHCLHLLSKCISFSERFNMLLGVMVVAALSAAGSKGMANLQTYEAYRTVDGARIHTLKLLEKGPVGCEGA